jgi:hypothetical protein
MDGWEIIMSKTLVEPRVADEGVVFTVTAGFVERECIVSKNALAYLARLQGHTMNFMNTYLAFEARIHAVARRLVIAGESASPLILGAAYFIDAGMPPAS